MVESSNAASESCLPFMEMRSSTAAGGLVPTGEASKASGTTSNEPLLRFYETEEVNPEGDSKMETCMDFDSIRLVRQQQLLENICCSILLQGR